MKVMCGITRYLLLSFVVLGFLSCEKDIDIELQSRQPKLVVEATIENGKAPTVFLSRSLDFFSEINPEILESSFVHDAVITVSDGVRTNQLIEVAVETTAGYMVYYYTSDPSDPDAAITGTLNTSYQLEIRTGDTTYQASTTIPKITKVIDSLWWEPLDFTEEGDSNLVRVKVRVTDPPGFGDYVRYFTKRNKESYFPAPNSVYDDQVIDGTTYEIPVDRGTNRNLERDENDSFFEKGDTVVLKLCSIDKATYDFWRTYEFSYQSIGNPFSSPTKVTSNISNGALGYFGGYAAQFRSLIIPK